MGQIKAQQVNWLDQAWIVSGVIAEVPSNPPGGLLDPAPTTKRWAMNPKVRRALEVLQDTIALHLAYRLSVVHKIRVLRKDGAKGMFMVMERDPSTMTNAYMTFAALGVKPDKVDLWAIDAHAKLGRILIDHFVCDEWKRTLPLIVASIGGASASDSAKLKAGRQRKRSIALRDEKLAAMAKHPHDGWKRLLRMLEGDNGCVTRWNDDWVEWINYDGATKTTKTGTFKNWK